MDCTVYKVSPARSQFPGPPLEGSPAFRVAARALEGMQKEALVFQARPPGAAWRLVSDEGPYLNGTDLAPFPLGFFTAGLQFCFLTRFLSLVRAENVSLKSLAATQDNRYSMSGSMIRGDMAGGAFPAELSLAVESDAPAGVIARLAAKAESESPAHAVMRDILANTFSLSCNGRPVEVPGLRPAARRLPDPRPVFSGLRPDAPGACLPDIVTKTATAETKAGVEGGAGSSLQAEQKRILRVRGIARLLSASLFESHIQLIQPLGSNFRFLCGAADAESKTPPPLAFLSAGVGFCYMTQLGRYAQIKKRDMSSLRILQDNVFRPAGALPVETHVFLDSADPEGAAGEAARMGEQTCFLHAAMRGSHPTVLRIELNGRAIAAEVR